MMTSEVEIFIAGVRALTPDTQGVLQTCAARGCRSGLPPSIGVNELIDTGEGLCTVAQVGLCAQCASTLGLKENDALPEPEAVRRALDTQGDG